MRRTVLVLASCTGDGPEDDPCLPGDRPTLTIGLGESAYEPVADGGELPLIHGPQGGFHLPIGLLATHLDVSDLVTGHLEGSVDGTVLASTDPWLDFRCEADAGGLTTWGTFLIYDSTPAELDGKTTTVTASVRDVSGTEVSVTTDFVIRDRP